jgi:hypothetical protein
VLPNLLFCNDIIIYSIYGCFCYIYCMKTLPEYCDQTIEGMLSLVVVNNGDIDRGDTNVKMMTTSLINSMSAQKDTYPFVKWTASGIRFKYRDNDFYLKRNETGVWTVVNMTMKRLLESDYFTTWHKYDNFTSNPNKQ